MERLTKRFEDGRAYIYSGVTVNTKDIPKVQAKAQQKAINRLAELEDKLESGQLVELPCKLGENFVIRDYGFGRLRVEERRIVGYNFSQFDPTIFPVSQYEESFAPDRVFAAKAQAEARLKELKEYL